MKFFNLEILKNQEPKILNVGRRPNGVVPAASTMKLLPLQYSARYGRPGVPFNFFNYCLSCRVGISVLPKKILKHRARTPPHILFSHRFCAIHMGVQNRTRGG